MSHGGRRRLASASTSLAAGSHPRSPNAKRRANPFQKLRAPHLTEAVSIMAFEIVRRRPLPAPADVAAGARPASENARGLAGGRYPNRTQQGHLPGWQNLDERSHTVPRQRRGSAS